MHQRYCERSKRTLIDRRSFSFRSSLVRRNYHFMSCNCWLLQMRMMEKRVHESKESCCSTVWNMLIESIKAMRCKREKSLCKTTTWRWTIVHCVASEMIFVSFVNRHAWQVNLSGAKLLAYATDHLYPQEFKFSHKSSLPTSWNFQRFSGRD